MENSIRKFLEFNGKVIYFLGKEGQYWIAIKPICEALGVDYKEQARDIKNDEILSQLSCEHTIVAADDRLRKMTCLPEKFVYGWIFSLKSKSPALKEYKLKCYEILFDHFHGAILGRKEMISDKVRRQLEKEKLVTRLMENPDYVKLLEADAIIKECNQKLAAMDKAVINEQLSLFKEG